MTTNANRSTHFDGCILAAALLLAASCATQEIESEGIFELSPTPTETHNAPLVLLVMPDAAMPGNGYLISSAEYALRIDGLRAAFQDGSTPYPIEHIRAQLGPGAFVPAGQHTIQLVDRDGNTVLGTQALDLQPDRTNILAAFGPRSQLSYRLVAEDMLVPPGTSRFLVVNLIPTGYAAEIVRCDRESLDTCTTKLAGPIASHQSAHVDLPEPATVPCNESVGPGITCTVGPWAAYRVVPTVDAAGLGAAPSRPSAVATDLAGFLHHPNAAQIRFAAPFFVDPEMGIPSSF
jgi:hypothetical protein